MRNLLQHSPLLLVLSLVACKAIAGIHDRQYIEDDAGSARNAMPSKGVSEQAQRSEPASQGPEDAGASATISDEEDAGADETPDAGAPMDGGSVERVLPPPSALQCETYCADLDSACNEDNQATVYPDPNYCRAICPHFERGSDTDANTFDCRARQAAIAHMFEAQPTEIAPNCFAASAGSGGKCGTTCEAYCQLFGDICLEGEADPECMRRCTKLVDKPQSGSVAFMGGDTLQCRLAHLSAATVDSETHCPHAGLFPSDGTPCAPTIPSCESYCALLESACATDTLSQYESRESCKYSCEHGGIPLGPLREDQQDDDVNSIACRRHHTYNAIRLGSDHCAHAGLGGDGHCGPLCQNYCELAQTLCPSQYISAFGDPDTAAATQACRDDCAATEKQEGYSVALGRVAGPTLQCRLYHLSEARKGATECEAALGNGVCQ